MSGAWPLVKRRLEDKEEWPEVLSEGVRFARELCVHQAGDTLIALMKRGLKPDAWEPDADLGLQALSALLQLGGEPAKSATRLANEPGVRPPSRRPTRPNTPIRDRAAQPDNAVVIHSYSVVAWPLL